MYHKSLWISLKRYKINPVIKVLILADFTIWSASGLIGPIFSIFVAQKIGGSSGIEVAGFAATIYLITRSVLEIPVGIFIDKKKGERDDLLCQVIGSSIIGVSYVLYAFSTTNMHIYAIQLVMGIGAAVSYPAWYSMFSKFVDKKMIGFEWSFYDVVTAAGMALSASLGALIATRFGFDILFYVVGALVAIGALVPLFVYNSIDDTPQS